MPPFPTSTPLSQGGAAHGNAYPHAPCALSLGCPFPSFPASGHLFIYLFIYLSYLLVFIDNWKSGWGGGAHFCCTVGAAGSPPHPAPCLLGCCWEHLWGGMLVGPQAPIPFLRGRGGKGKHTVPAGRAPGARPLPAEARCPCAPSPAHPCLLTLPPGASPAGFDVSSSWRGREEPGWMNATTENRPNQVFCCHVGKIRERGKLVLQSALKTNDFTQ